jgi:hypothetical protein
VMNDECMAGSVPVQVCPAYGQGALDAQMGSRGESDSEHNSQHAATVELVTPNSPVHTPASGGDAASADPHPQQQCRRSSSNGPSAADGNNSAQHPSAERQHLCVNGASVRRIPPCAVSAENCERSAGSNASNALRLSCIAEPNAFGVKPLAAQQVGEPKISYEPPSAERLSSTMEAKPFPQQQEVKTQIRPPAAEQGGILFGLLSYPRNAKVDTPWRCDAHLPTSIADEPTSADRNDRTGTHTDSEPLNDHLCEKTLVTPMPADHCVSNTFRSPPGNSEAANLPPPMPPAADEKNIKDKNADEELSVAILAQAILAQAILAQAVWFRVRPAFC